MKISELSKKPQLTKVTLSSPKIIERYGDEIEFWMWDRQPLDVFAKLSTGDSADSNIVELISNLILDENGDNVIKDGNVLPIDVVTECMTEIGKVLGK
jgi:hypothetical protein